MRKSNQIDSQQEINVFTLSELIKISLFLLYFDFNLVKTDRTVSSYFKWLELNKYVTKLVFK